MGGQITKPPPAPIIIPVTQVGEYALVKTLGKGAFGEVHLVKNRSGKEFALKQIMCVNQTAVDMALREIEMLKKLTHPAIVKLEKGTYHEYLGHKAVCIVMEYVDGTDLASFLSKVREKPDTQLVMKWFLTLLDALVYIHANGIGHRDLKPANILIDTEGNLKIADFGISQTASQSSAAFGTIAGTLMYMAPEQLKQEKYDTRVDVWSLGCILYEVYTGDTIREVMAIKLAQNSNLLESTVDNTSIQQLLSLMLCMKDTRLTSKQLLEHDIVKGWRDLLADKDEAPKTTHYLLPFVSSLGPGSPILRLSAIKYLQNWSKISAVHKAINRYGIDGLTASLTVPETGVADKLNNHLVVAMMTALCNRVHVGPASSKALYSSGAYTKLMKLIRSSDNNSFVESVAQLISLIIRNPQLCYVMDRQEALNDWVAAGLHDGTSSKMFSAAENIYVDLPYFPNENWAWPIWLNAVKSDKVVTRLVRLIQHRLEPHLLVTPSTQSSFQNVVRTLEREPLEKDRAEAILRLVRSYDRPIAQAYLKGLCTFQVTGEVFIRQIFFHCKTCYPTERSNGCCLSCAYTCHKGHNLKYRPPNNAYCDCGTTSKCQARGQNDCSAVATLDLIPAASITTSVNTNNEVLTWRHEDYAEARIQQSTCLYQPFGFDLTFHTGSLNATAFYFEVEIVECPKSVISIGFAPLSTDKSAPKKLPGYSNMTWGYHNDDGKLYVCGRSGKGNMFGPTYSVGDVVGCGVTGGGKVFYTINGMFVGCVTEANMEPGNKMFATVGRIGKSPMLVRVRIKAPFKFTSTYDDLPREPLCPGSLSLNTLALELLFGGSKMEDSVVVRKYFNSNLPIDLVAHFAHVLQLHNADAADRTMAELGGQLRRSRSRLVQKLQLSAVDRYDTPPIERKVSPAADYDIPQPRVNTGTSPVPLGSEYANTPRTPEVVKISSTVLPNELISARPTGESNIDPGLPHATLPSAGAFDQPAVMAMMQQFFSTISQTPPVAVAPASPQSTSSPGPAVSSPAALMIRIAHNEKSAYELNIVTRTMSALIADFWTALADDYSPDKFKIAKIEKTSGTARVEIKQDRSVERLKDDDELVFHLVEI